MINSDLTLPKLLAERANTHTNKVALRQKDLGIWNEMTWGEYLSHAEALAIILEKDFAFKKSDTIMLIGENRPQWLFSQMAIQVLGGVAVGIYQESLPEQLKYYLNDTQVKIVIVEDQEQVDKLLEVEAETPHLEHIIYYNEQGMSHYDHPKLMSLGSLLEKGEALLVNETDYFLNKAKLLSGNDNAIIAYSAATTGNPKGALLTHTNLIAAGKHLEEVDNINYQDDYLSFLPLAWIHEQILSITIPLLKGSIVNFPERPSTVLSDLREIGPHTLLGPPRVYQTIMSNFITRINGASWFKKKVFNMFKKHGDKVAHAKLTNEKVSGMSKFMFKLGDWLVFSAIRDHFGLARVKRAYIAGASLNSEVYYFYHSIGINLKQTYGGTELAGIAFVQADDDIRVESSGKPLPQTEVKIGEDNEIFVKNPAIFAHYLNAEDDKQITDGWLSLGDCGYISDEGQLVILDRKEDIIKADNNENVYPTAVENKLKVSPYIQEAIIIGQNRPYLTAILNIDMTSVGRWADREQLVYTSYEDLSLNQRVVDLVEQEVRQLIAELPEHARIKRFVLLHHQFNANDGELTRTLKLRRKFVTDKFQKVIDSMYLNQKTIDMSDPDDDFRKEKIELQIIDLDSKQEEVA